MEISEIYQIYKKSSGVCTDTRKIVQHNLFFALKGPNFNANQLAKEAHEKGALAVIIDDEEYLEPNCILVDNVLETLQKLAIYHRKKFNIPVIGITGSNGKTTTKELISEVLKTSFKIHFTKGNLNNHIGVPLTLLEMPTDTEIAVIEMGANHIGDIEELCAIADPNFGLITNIGKAHLEGFGSFEGVTKAKSELYTHLFINKGTLFINSLDKHLMSLSNHFEQRITYPQKNDYCTCICIDSNPLLKVKYQNEIIQTNLIGLYNFSNVAVAICIGQYFKISPENIKYALEHYIPTNNRSQILKKGTNLIVLDAYNANPSSMKAAIDNFKTMTASKKMLILGDMLELGTESAAEHEKIGAITNNSEFNSVFLVGKEMLCAALENNNAIHFENKDELAIYLSTNKPENAHILIKGSRGIALESIVNLL